MTAIRDGGGPLDDITRQTAYTSACVFGHRKILPTVVDRDRVHAWDDDLFRSMGKAGLLGLPLPRDDGGQATTAFDTGLAMEGFGYGAGDAGLALAWAAHTVLCGVPIARFGHRLLRRRYLPGMCDGTRIGAFAGPEPTSGTAPTRIRTRAARRGRGWCLDGEKTWVINGPIAQHVLVLAATQPDAGIEGLSAFVVECDAPGVRREPAIVTAGMRTARFGTISFDHCMLQNSALLGSEGGGIDVLRLIQRWERALLLAPWLGLMRAAAGHAMRHVRDGSELGRALGLLPATRSAIANIAICNEVTRRMVYRATIEIDKAEGDGRSAALARFVLLDNVQDVLRMVRELHGAPGLVPDSDVERWCRDVTVLPALGDRGDLLRSVVADALLDLD
ncbi:acyl-CoA dehydrogenase family protein [Inquilinus sp. CA228]|uniref:acyl-CoA dehydrogenase family protein n=1 Tax=Inquilinus sp. CA228 TaxID=3455609 RepID=UPI003F8D155C